MARNINKAIARALPLAGKVALLGPEGAMDALRSEFQYKVSKKIRALPGTDNAYKAELRKDRSRMNSLIKATGCESYEEAIKWIRAAKRLRG